MPLDPQAQQVLDQLAALGLPPNHMVSPQQARENMRNRPRVDGPAVANVEDRTVSWRDAEVPVRIYTPAGTGPFPILIWCHGGGMVVGDLDTADPTARHLTVQAGCVTVSVDYRLAPETKFPGACDDCYTPPRSGPRKTPPASRATPRAWRSAATAPAATWPRWWRKWRATAPIPDLALQLAGLPDDGPRLRDAVLHATTPTATC